MTSTAQYPLKEFEEFLKTRKLGESSRHQVVLSMRRALKHIGPERLTDRSELMLYRMSMPEATRRLFGYGWSKFREYAEINGQDVPDLPQMPVIKLVHPLWADITDLTVHFNIHQIENLRWIAVKDADETLYAAARRAFEFIAGRDPLDSDWLVPRDSGAAEPMPYWMIDTILRTNAIEDSRDTEKAAFALLENVTRRDITASQLKELWASVEGSVASQKGRRRILRLESILDEPSKPWTDEDHKNALGILSAVVP
jgi:hypothetical protein